eukprot:IDg2217t1
MKNENRSMPYAQKLRSAALALPGGIQEDVLLNRLKAGIPGRLRDQAHLVSGTFDEVVSRLSRVSAAQMSREDIREVNEEVSPGSFNAPMTSNSYANYICHYCQVKGHIASYINLGDKSWYLKNGGDIVKDSSTATGADGRSLDVTGRGFLRFRLWGCDFYEEVRVMSTLPSKLLIGLRFWRKNFLLLNLEANCGTITVNGKQYRGTVSTTYPIQLSSEGVQKVIEDSDVDEYILHLMDLGNFPWSMA